MDAFVYATVKVQIEQGDTTAAKAVEEHLGTLFQDPAFVQAINDLPVNTNRVDVTLGTEHGTFELFSF